MRKLFTLLFFVATTFVVHAQNCVPFFSYQYNPVSGETFFTASVPNADSTSYPIFYTWMFGDGSSGTGENVTHSYNASGYYSVCVVSTTADSCTGTYCDSVYISGMASNCITDFNFFTDSMNVPPMTTYTFVDQSTPDNGSTITSWSWSFPGGTPSTSTSQNPQVVFNTPGTYTVCLTTATSGGCTSNSCQTIVIQGTGCQLYATFNTQSPTTIGGNDGFIETSVFNGTAPYTYYWSNSATTPDIYNLTSGIYTLNIVDAYGCQMTYTQTLYEPWDTTGGIIVDTLTTNVIDTCLNFIPDTFFIASFITDPLTNTVTVTWVFMGGGITQTLIVSYIYTYVGNNAIIITINCGTKALTSYMSYIHIYETAAGVLPVFGNENNLVTYPVPFKDKLNLTFSATGKVNISIFDATGRIVYVKPTFEAHGTVNEEINTTVLPSGAYILNIENNGTLIHQQVIK